MFIRCREEAVEIIVALKNLGEKLAPQEKAFLDSSSEVMARFESAESTSIGKRIVAYVLCICYH